MSFTVRRIVIPHRRQRSFAHAADIYRVTVQELNQSPGPIHDIYFELRQILGSEVDLHILEGAPPAGLEETTVKFRRGSQDMFAILKNAGGEIQLRETYGFDESAVKPALREKNGEFSFRHRFHESNIHMLLSPIKFILPTWPAKPEDARVLRLNFAMDVQGLDLENFSLRTNPRRSFSITQFLYGGEPVGEAVHYFLNEGAR